MEKDKSLEKRILILDQQIKKIELAMDLYLYSSRYNDRQKIKELKSLIDGSIDTTENSVFIEKKIAKIIFNTLFNFDQKQLPETSAKSVGYSEFSDICTKLGLSFMDIYYKKIKGVKWVEMSFFDYKYFNYKDLLWKIEEDMWETRYNPICEEDEKEHWGEELDFGETEAYIESALRKKEDIESLWETDAWGDVDIDEEKVRETAEEIKAKKSVPLDELMGRVIERLKEKIQRPYAKKESNPWDSDYLKSKRHFEKALNKEGEVLYQQYKDFKFWVDKGILMHMDPENCDYLKAKIYFKDALKSLNEKKDLKELFRILPKLAEYMVEDFLKSLKAFDLNFNQKLPFEKSNLTEVLNKSISLSKARHKSWKKNYNKMNKLLEKRFPVDKDLIHKEYDKVCEDLKSFRKEYCNKTLKKVLHKPWISNSYHSAMDSYLLDFIKILEGKGSKFNGIIAKLYVSYVVDYTLPLDDGRKELHYLKKAIKTDRNSLDAYHALAKYYEKNSNRKKALESWAQLIKCYFAKVEGKNFKRSGNSTNEVGKIDSYFFEDLVLKKSKKDLSQEYKITEFIYNLVQNKELTSEPIALIKEPDGTSYIILKKANSSKTLGDEMRCLSKIKGDKLVFSKIKWTSEEEIIDRFKLNYFKKVIDSLVRIHKTGKDLEEQIDQYDYEDKLKVKLRELFPKDKDNIYKNCSFLVDYLKSLPQQFGHCDFYPENILVLNLQIKESQFNRINNEFCTIDYEKASTVNRYFDLTYLLEQAQLAIPQKVKESLIKHFKEKIKDKSSLEDVMKIYDHNALFINLSLAGTSSKWAYKGKEYERRKHKYLTQAKETLERMEKNHGMDLGYLKRVLN